MMEWLNEVINSTKIDIWTTIVRLIISFLLGAIVGTERQMRRREAGLRTFTLICLGSTMAMLISIWIPQIYPNFLNGDPGRIAAQVLTGIGFLGAGAIIQSRGSVYGLTTAACIWVVAVIGLAVGAGMFTAAIIVTALTVTILISLERFEKRMLLDGVNKILVIVCSTAEPDLKRMRKTLEEQNVYVMSNSYELNCESNTAVLRCKVNVKPRSSYASLFTAIRKNSYITQIKILA